MYRLLKKLKALSGEDVTTESNQEKLQLLREDIKENLAKAHERYEKQYNTRAKERYFSEGQEVYRINFVLSDASNKICKKISKKFLPSRVKKRIGNNLYELQNSQGKDVGTFHVKDIILK